jgi:hypothetical protein
MLQQSMRLRADELYFAWLAVQQEEKEVSCLCDRALALFFRCHCTHLPFGSWLWLILGLSPISNSRM